MNENGLILSWVTNLCILFIPEDFVRADRPTISIIIKLEFRIVDQNTVLSDFRAIKACIAFNQII